MPKKHLLNRLDNLFSELVQEKDQLGSGSTPSNLGWSWECDPRGYITACSDGVTSALGLPPEDFIGKQLVSFRLTPDSAQAFMVAFQNKESGSNTKLDYIAVNGDIVSVVTSFQKITVDQPSDPNPGWRGLIQIINGRGISPAERKIPANLEKDTTPYWRKPRHSQRRLGQLRGYLAENSHLVPVESELTQIGRESVHYKHILYQHARGDQPAVIAMPTGQENGNENILLEIEDTNPSRQWSEDELLLIEQVADQLTLALENAQLIEQTQAQADELNILRQISLELAFRAA